LAEKLVSGERALGKGDRVGKISEAELDFVSTEIPEMVDVLCG
jgi:hypothetical protein